MPQLHRLRVSVSLDKLPTRQREFLLSFLKINNFDAGKLYSHLIFYFFTHPTKNAVSNIVGFLGSSKDKVTLNFNSEVMVKFLSERKQTDREIYCLSALYEMSNYLAYMISQYFNALEIRKDPIATAKLENEVFQLGCGSFLHLFIDLMRDEEFKRNSIVMSASFNHENLQTALLINSYTEQLDTKEIVAVQQTHLEETKTENDVTRSDDWNHISIA